MIRQFIYRQERQEAFGTTLPGTASVRLLIRPTDAATCLLSLARVLGISETAKLLVKLATPRRKFYGVFVKEEMVGYGYVTMSRCRYYDVDEGSAVLGPVWTSPSSRGQGYATMGIQLVLDMLFSKGITVFYIDTSERNGAMQRVVEKCGFGAPVGDFPKEDDR
ncbi:MAG: GNAT family N-acetyltransferase [Lentisphaerae bacterium]|nr:GNAT family N-acetyltransferase [Lentisphaerota bacterium]